jgi:putative ABC transport system permease protein
MTVSLAGQPSYVGERREGFYRQMLDNLRALPGVESASLVNHLPVGGDTWRDSPLAEGKPEPPPGERIGAFYRIAHTGYLRTMRSRLRAGREFTDADRDGAPRVAMINEKLANRLFPGDDPLGKRITLGGNIWLTVVGVTANLKQESWSTEPGDEFYVPLLQDREALINPHPWRAYITVVVRTSVPPESLANAARAAVWSLNKEAAISGVRSMEAVAASSIWQTRFYLLLGGLFAAVAMLLAAVGIYGVMAFSVSRRTREIGIRVAMGARRGQVIWMVLRQGMTLVLAGVLLGSVAALAAARGIGALLYGVTARDPATLALIPGVLIAAAAVACVVPARRACSVDPVTALRSE